ncbi:MAG: carboxypeptidase-like regulatory domain-containing protein [Roseivirga sp.]|nr:carboxypeptidase-like regulatory domain-containing protein [Roseivirga sp.]
MLRRFIHSISFLLLGLPFNTSAQHHISGQVFDITTLQPVELCNVYIVGTTLGASTDTKGHFSFEVPDSGDYELVYSHVGYLPQLISFKTQTDSLVLDPMPLDPITTSVDEVVVTGKKDRKWQRQYDRFLKYIMGTHFREKNVEILNPYAVEFKEGGRGMLTEARPFTLNMKNDYTGYEVHFLVQRLFLSKSNQFMVGYPGFTPLTSNSPDQVTLWKKNRLKAYEGSLRHIFKSILENKLEQAGFDTQITEKNPVKFQGSASKILPIEVDNTININAQNLFEHVKVSATENPNIKKIAFKELLRVTYTREVNSFGEPQQTLIEAMEGEFLVYTNGIPVNPTALKLYGYLASEGLYEMLPFDY